MGIVRLRQFPETGEGVSVSRLLVLRRDKAGWKIKLRADPRAIRNEAGYLAVDSLGRAPDFSGYRVLFLGEGIREVPGFAIVLFFLTPDGRNQGTPVEIMWNPSLGRFQEYTQYEDPASFRPEIPHSPQRRIRK